MARNAASQFALEHVSSLAADFTGRRQQDIHERLAASFDAVSQYIKTSLRLLMDRNGMWWLRKSLRLAASGYTLWDFVLELRYGLGQQPYPGLAFKTLGIVRGLL